MSQIVLTNPNTVDDKCVYPSTGQTDAEKKSTNKALSFINGVKDSIPGMVKDKDFWISIVGSIAVEMVVKKLATSVGSKLIGGGLFDIVSIGGIFSDVVDAKGFNKLIERGAIDELRINSFYKQITEAFNKPETKKQILDYIKCKNKGVLPDGAVESVNASMQLYQIKQPENPTIQCMSLPVSNDEDFQACDGFYTDKFIQYWNANKSVISSVKYDPKDVTPDEPDKDTDPEEDTTFPDKLKSWWNSLSTKSIQTMVAIVVIVLIICCIFCVAIAV